MNRIINRRADATKAIAAVERDKRDAIIEECARAINDLYKGGAGNNINYTIALIEAVAAIRALKDKPSDAA